MSVSTLAVVIKFDTLEGQMRVIIETPQPIVLLLFGYDTELGGTTNVFLGVV